MAAFVIRTTGSSTAGTCFRRAISNWSQNLSGKIQEGMINRGKNVADKGSKNDEEDQVLHVNWELKCLLNHDKLNHSFFLNIKSQQLFLISSNKWKMNFAVQGIPRLKRLFSESFSRWEFFLFRLESPTSRRFRWGKVFWKILFAWFLDQKSHLWANLYQIWIRFLNISALPFFSP